MAFTNKATITIPASKIAGSGSETNFTLLFKGTFAGSGNDPDLRHTGSGGDVTSTSGYDIAFSSDGVSADLDFSLRKYVSSTGEVIFWVRVPTITFGADHTLWVLYGDTGITSDQSNATGVWQDADVAVLLDQPSGVAVDETGKYLFSAGGTPTPASAGKIHQSVDFNGTTDGYWDGISRQTVLQDAYTMSAWINADTLSAQPNGTFVQWTNENYHNNFNRFYNDGGGPTMRLRDLWAGTSSTHDVTGAGIATGTWIHVTGKATKDGNSKLLINGVVRSTQAVSGNSISGGGVDFSLGCYAITGNLSQFFDGRVEAFVGYYNIEQSDQRIKAEYENQNDPSTFYTVEQVYGYTYNKYITIPASKVPGSGTESDFIFLFTGIYNGSGDDPDLRSVGNGGDVQSTNGYDIAFSTDGVNADLDFELVKYVPTTGEVLFWVRIPTLNLGVDNEFRLLYGNSSISINQSTTDTWQSYVVVQHLGVGAYGSGFTPATSNAFPDSTGNNFNGTSSWNTNNRQSTNRVFGDFSTDFNSGNGDTTTLIGLGTGISEDTVTWAEYFTGATGGQELSAFNSDFSKYTYTTQNDQTVDNDLIYNGQQTSPSEYAINHDPGTDDYFFEFAVSSPTKKNTFRLFMRSSNITDYRQNSYEIEFIIDIDTSHTVKLYKWTSGSKSAALATKTWGAGAIGINNPFVIRGECNGSVISVRGWDGQWITYTDGSPLTGRYSGFEFLRNTADVGAWIDNMKIGTISGIASNEITIQAWIYPQNNSSVWVSDTKDTNGVSMYSYIDTSYRLYWSWESEDTPGAGTVTSSVNTAPLNTWSLIHLTANGANGRVIGNGVSKGTTTAFQTPTRLAGYSVFLGRYGGSPQIFDGQMQEFRVRKDELSTAFATAEYNNQSDPSTFYAVGDYEKQPSLVVGLTTDNALVTGESPLTNFPILVSMTRDYLKTVANGGQVELSTGWDIWFEETNGTQLDHEIEKWDGTTGELVAWVRIPSLPDTSDYTINLLFGDSGVPAPTENPTGVWDSSYDAVWHLADNNYPYESDSTTNNREIEASTIGANIDQVDAQVYKGYNLDGVDHNFFDLTGQVNTTWLSGYTQLTIEAWVNIEVLKTNNYIFYHGNHAITNLMAGLRVGNAVGTSAVQFWVSDDGSTTTGAISADGAVSLGSYAHIVGVYNGSNLVKLYVDGSEVTYNTQNVGPGSIISDNQRVTIGAIDGNYSDLIVDEVRVSSTARSSGWVSTSYENQSAPESFLTDTVPVPAGYTYTGRFEVDPAHVYGSDHTDFPVPFRGTYAWLADTGNGGKLESSSGYDLIFTDGEGNILDHEIEKYVNTTGELVMWVRVPTLSSSAITTVYYHYGNASVTTSQENVTGVWDSNFLGVWHMSETSGTRFDSTINANDGTPQGTVNSVAGRVDGGMNLPSDNDRINVGNGINLTDTFTVSGWINPTSLTLTNTYIAGEAIGVSPFNLWRIYVSSPSARRVSFLWNDNVPTGHGASTAVSDTLQDGVWNYIVGSYDNANTNIYYNGEISGQQAGVSLPDMYPGSENTILGGHDSGGVGYPSPLNEFVGNLDEWRISNVARSAGWVKTEYASMTETKFYDIIDQFAPADVTDFYGRIEATVPFDQVTGDSDHTNFPVLYQTTNDAFKTVANGGLVQSASGYDIWFTDTSNNALDFEISSWDGTTGAITAWVRIPTLFDLTDTTFYVYVGNEEIVSDLSNPTGVWQEYNAVWHLDETSAGSVSVTRADSTANANTLQDPNTVASGTGQVLNGADFEYDNPDEYLGISDASQTGLDITGLISYSMWFKMESAAPVGNFILFSKDDLASSRQYGASIVEANQRSRFFYSQDGGNGTLGVLEIEETLSPATMYHLGVSIDPSTQSGIAVINGVEKTVTALVTNGSAIFSGTAPFNIAAQNNSSNNTEFDGIIDELKIRDDSKGIGWFTTEYANQSDPSAFVQNSPVLTPFLQGFSYVGTITVDSTKVSGTSHTDFPVLWKGTYSWLKDTGNGGLLTSSNGYDLVFSDGLGNLLDFEVQKYDNTTGELIIWIKTPILSGTTDTNIYYHYTNSSILTDQSNTSGTWSEFERVWHMSSDYSSPFIDTFTAPDTTQIEGYNGWATWPVTTTHFQIFSNKMNAIGSGSNHAYNSQLADSDDHTVSADVTLQSISDEVNLIARGTNMGSGLNNNYRFYVDGNNNWSILRTTFDANSYLTGGSTPITLGQEYNFAIKVEGSTNPVITVYKDTVQIGSYTDTSGSQHTTGRQNGFVLRSWTGTNSTLDNFSIEAISYYLPEATGVADATKLSATEPNPDTNGQIEASQFFDDNDDRATSDEMTGLTPLGSGAISFWAYLTDNNERFQNAITIGDSTTPSAGNTTNLNVNINYRDDIVLDFFQASLDIDGTRYWALTSDVNSLDPYVGNWTHFILVQNGTEASMYINGNLQNKTWATSVDRTKWIDDLYTGTQVADQVCIGNYNNNNAFQYTYAYNDKLEHMKISDITDTNWLITEYTMESDPSGFISITDPNEPVVTPAQWRIFGDEGLVA